MFQAMRRGTGDSVRKREGQSETTSEPRQTMRCDVLGPPSCRHPTRGRGGWVQNRQNAFGEVFRATICTAACCSPRKAPLQTCRVQVVPEEAPFPLPPPLSTVNQMSAKITGFMIFSQGSLSLKSVRYAKSTPLPSEPFFKK